MSNDANCATSSLDCETPRPQLSAEQTAASNGGTSLPSLVDHQSSATSSKHLASIDTPVVHSDLPAQTSDDTSQHHVALRQDESMLDVSDANGAAGILIANSTFDDNKHHGSGELKVSPTAAIFHQK